MVMEDPELEFSAATLANSNDCVVPIHIDLLHGYLYPQNFSHKWKSKTVLNHCIKSDSLLGFVVCVHDRFRNERIKVGIVSAKILAGGLSSRTAYLTIAHVNSWCPPSICVAPQLPMRASYLIRKIRCSRIRFSTMV